MTERDPAKLAQRIADEATRHCRAHWGALFLQPASPAPGDARLHALAGTAAPALSERLRSTQMRARALEPDGVLHVADARRAPRAALEKVPAAALPARSYLALPLAAPDQEVVGALLLGHGEAKAFQGIDEQVLVVFAAQAGAAIDKLRALAQIESERDVQASRARMLEEVGIALTRPGALGAKLRRCTDAVVEGLGAAFARIWQVDATGDVLVLRASSGLYTHLDGPHSRVPVGDLKIGLIAQERRPHLTNDVANDPRVSDKTWARRERMVAFAGYPLIMGDRVLGVLAVFSRHPLPEAALGLLGSVAQLIALALDGDARARDDERFRDLFLGMLGHDLRNPLHSIALAAEVLDLDDELGETSRQMRERIHASVDRMGRMVGQLLDFARIRGGDQGIPLQRTWTDLHAVARDVVDELRVANPGRSIRQSYRGDGRGLFDRDRLAQALSNLLGNALEHGREGTPVTLGVEREGDRIAVWIHNDGDPIPEELLPVLFDPYRRPRRARSDEGLGLGLVITQGIVHAHGGELEVETSPQEGTIFRFRLRAGGPPG